MDFFSEIGKKVSNAAKNVQKRTSEVVETSRLNGEMRSLRDQRDRLFTRIGELVYKARNSEVDLTQVDDAMDQIDLLNARLEELQAQIDKLSQQKRCPACGSVVSAEARFCPSCGERLPEPEPEKAPEPEEKTGFCSGCGAQLEKDSAFCPACGKPVEAPAQAEINWPEAAQPEAAEAPEEENASGD